ncbi:hypothetical protein SAY87_008136 [Trapa incisa]|uniref:Uncharacterized protein n=1 Tax=Trapa incisa TaxID=236973 RepID=A0AAN7KFJ3_9MYRT|nr:hypothetical protein SAY87_008136 [Trapa incisa]
MWGMVTGNKEKKGISKQSHGHMTLWHLLGVQRIRVIGDYEQLASPVVKRWTWTGDLVGRFLFLPSSHPPSTQLLIAVFATPPCDPSYSPSSDNHSSSSSSTMTI